METGTLTTDGQALLAVVAFIVVIGVLKSIAIDIIKPAIIFVIAVLVADHFLPQLHIIQTLQSLLSSVEAKLPPDFWKNAAAWINDAASWLMDTLKNFASSQQGGTPTPPTPTKP